MKIKKLSKLMLPLLGLTLIAGSVATTTSCTHKSSDTQEASPKDAEAAINALIFQKNGQVVNEDFDLPMTVGKQSIPLTWESNNEAVTVEASNNKIVAKVKKPDTAVTVTLTASVTVKKKTFSKTFTVKVLPYSVTDFVEKFKLEKKDQIVWEDFKLDSEITLDGKTCPITWVSTDPEVLKVEDGKAKVTTQENKTKVTLTATFTYNNEEADYVADIYVWHELSETEKFNLFYDDLGNNTFDIMGYVVAKAGYNPSYKNGNVFLANTTLDGGYYCYRVVMEEEEWNKVEVGTRLLVKAAKSTSYNGLIETTGSQEGEIITDDSVLAPLTETQENALLNGAGNSVDNQFVLDSGLMKKTGTTVSLDGWTIKSLGSATAKDGGTILTVSRGEGDAEVTVDLVLNKYSVDLDSELANSIITSIAALNLKVGDRVRISGGLYCANNTYQIHAINKDFAVQVSDKTDDSSSADAIKILAEKAKIDALIPSVVVENKIIDLYTTEDDNVLITYNLYNTDVATLENNKLTVTPTDEAVKFTLEITIAVKDGYSYTYTQQITTKIATDEDMVNDTLDEFSDESQEIKTPKAIELSENGTTFTNVALTYEVTKGGSENVFIDDVGKLVIYPTTTAQEIEVTVTATLNAATATKVIKYTVPAMKLTGLDAEFVDKAFYYVEGTVTEIKSTQYGNMYIEDENHNKIYLYGFYNVYNTRYDKLTVQPQVGDVVRVYGEYALYNEEKEIKNGVFIPTGTFIANYEANKVKAVLEENLSATVTAAKEIEFSLDYPQATINLTTTNAIWTFADNKLTITPTENVFEGPITFEVSYGSTTVAVSKTFKATTNVSDAEKVEAVLAELKGETFTAPGTFELAANGQAYSDVALTYSNISTNAAATLDNGKLVVYPQADDVTFTLTVTATVGSETATKTLSYTVNKYTITPLTSEFTTNSYYYVEGTVTKLLTGTSLYGSFFIQDDNGNEFEIYKVKKIDGTIVAKADSASTVGIEVGNKVVAYGYYSVYKTTKEICEAYIVSNEEPTPTELLEMEKASVEAQLDSALGTSTITSNRTVTINLSKESMTLSLVGNYTTVSLEGNVLTITPTTEELSTTLTLRITYSYGSGQLTKDVTKTIVTKKDQSGTVEVSTSFSVTADTKLTDSVSDNATALGLDSSIFSVTSIKNDATVHVGLNPDGTIRLYNKKDSSNGEALKIEVASGYKIVSIKYNIASSSTSEAYEVTTGTTALTATDGVYTVNGSEVTIKNTDTPNNQLRFTSIDIVYIAV